MAIVFDSINYVALGKMLYAHGWIDYFKTGPNREPLYPLLIALSMHIEHFTGLAYVKIIALFGVMILLLTQILTYKILRLLNIRHGICTAVLLYMALSPALNNTAFSLFSEIATYPFLLMIVLTSFYAWEAIKQEKRLAALTYGVLLGISLALITLIKGIFEGIAPVYLIILFSAIFFTDKQIITKKLIPFSLCLAAAVILFFSPISGFKWLNWNYNGNFVVTSRGTCLIYGNTARRMEPLTFKKFSEALAYVPGEGVCNSIFGAKECDFWSFYKSDELGHAQEDELSRQHLSADKINNTLMNLSVQKVLHNPAQYILLAGIEGLEMFFWESTQIGFVDYPHWLSKIYNVKIFNAGLRFIVSLMSLIAVMSLWLQALTPQRSPLGFLIGVLIFIYILFYSLVSILTRYALPIAPLFLIAIGIWLNQILSPKKIN